MVVLIGICPRFGAPENSSTTGSVKRLLNNGSRLLEHITKSMLLFLIEDRNVGFSELIIEYSRKFLVVLVVNLITPQAISSIVVTKFYNSFCFELASLFLS